MAIKTYKYNDKTQLTEHFRVSEWKCKCGKNHEIKIDDKLPKLLEELRTKLNASAGNIYSGYRCIDHDKAVGGSGSTNRSHAGYAVDIIFLSKNKKPIPSSKVAILLEDLGHKYGIGYRCGKSKDENGNIHIDTKNRKWYGDESKNNNQSISSFKAPSDNKSGHKNYLDYLYKPVSKYVNASVLNIRKEPNANGEIIGGYEYGKKINVYYIENEWAKVGVAKWVSAKYIQDTKPTEKSAVSVENNGVKEEKAPKNENTVQNEVEKVEESPVIDKNSANEEELDYEYRKDANNPLFYLIDLLIEFIKKLFGKK